MTAKFGEWLPIESAPKDGTRVILYSPDAAIDNPFIAAWREYENAPEGGVWFEREDDPFAVDAEPTLWMPLPRTEQSDLELAGAGGMK